jgi:BirA family biotin operon repressor/biotin-[acetyl-CoA-carboxylase] ligase
MNDWKPDPQQESINADALRKALGECMFARNVIVQESLPSTNTLARELGLQGAPEGTLVLSEEQTAGKGRMGKRWHSPKYANLLFSVLLRPRLETQRVFVLTMVFALACAEAVEAVSGVSPTIKWPNDLFASGKKLGGILTEFSAESGGVEQVVLGLGLNVNWSPQPWECERYPATSVRAESGRNVSREQLLVKTLMGLEGYYRTIAAGKVEKVQARWNTRSMLLGKRVAVDTGGEIVRGTAVGIDEMGALMLKDPSGALQRVINGDVSLEEIQDDGVGNG